MDVRRVLGTDLLMAAVDNAEDVTWILWPEKVCAYYEQAGSVLCFCPQRDQGYLLTGLQQAQLFRVEENLFIVDKTGIYIWDGVETIARADISSWRKMDIGKNVYCGWSDFRYRIRLADREYRLPLAANDVRLLADGTGAFWEYWGTIFCWNEEGVFSLESISESYEQLISLDGGWLAAIYDRQVTVIHSKYPRKMWEDPNLLDVIPNEDKSGLLLLLADGFVLEWCPAQQDEPDEVAEVHGEIFIAYDAVLLDEEIVWIDSQGV